MVSPTTGSVTSHDGTTIGYRQVGEGPGVILLHGGMQSSYNFVELGTALADSFTVYIPDRRGRGLSGPAGEEHSLQTECDDVAALLDHTGAHNVFGLSSGAVIALQAALTLPAINKVVAYDPPLFTEQINPIEWGDRVERELAHGEPVHALLTVGRGTQTFPRVFRIVPRFLLVPVLRYILTRYEQRTQDEQVPITDLIQTMTYDLQLIRRAHCTPESFKDLSAAVLLLTGSNSPAFLRATLDVLSTVVPHATRRELSGLSHTGPESEGNPQRVAQELRHFFSE